MVCCQSNPATLQALAAAVRDIGSPFAAGSNEAVIDVGYPSSLYGAPGEGNTLTFGQPPQVEPVHPAWLIKIVNGVSAPVIVMVAVRGCGDGLEETAHATRSTAPGVATQPTYGHVKF